MNFLNKLEKKFGRYAIPNLIVWLLGAYGIGYALSVMNQGVLNILTLEPYYIIRGQVWRLVTWIFVPTSTQLFFALIMMIFYFQLGQILERTWGAFRFNVYIFGGLLCTVLGAFAIYAGYFLFTGDEIRNMGFYFSTYYINMTIFLAFAVCYPNMEVRLYFLIPIKMKWMAIVYGAFILFNMIDSNWFGRIAILMSILNFIIFYFSGGNSSRVTFAQKKRKQNFHKQMDRSRPAANGSTRHKCAVCGRTEKDDPHLEFRFCSKCDGNFEYCQDHLFTHQHTHRH
ncbi:MAG: hypothetical protein ACK5ML_03705 [Lachnospiraceae bacterium]